MAPQGGLGGPKDSSAAPHEELCEAALSCCPKLISLDSNKMPPLPPFLSVTVFCGERCCTVDREKDRSKQMWGEEKGEDNMGLACNLLISSRLPFLSSIIDNERG